MFIEVGEERDREGKSSNDKKSGLVKNFFLKLFYFGG